MRRSPMFLAILALSCAQMYAQTALPARAARIEFTGPFGMMNAVMRTAIADGRRMSPLTLEEDTTAFIMLPTCRTRAFTVSGSTRLVGDVSSLMRVLTVPDDPRRGVVVWTIASELVDAGTGKVLQKGLFRGASARATGPMDTTFSSTFSVNLARFKGRTVYVKMIFLVEPEMLNGRRMDIVDVRALRQRNSLR